MAFYLLWGIDLLVGLIVGGFFLAGISDGSVSADNIGLWCVLLAVLASVIGGSLALHLATQRVAAIVLAAVLALPALGFALLMGALIVLNPRWN